MKIYGHFLSAPSNKVRLTASALGLDFDYQHIDLTKGEHKSESFLAINPVGKVPALQDDEFCLYESDAMCRYLASKADSNLYPQELEHRALVEQWMNFGSNHIMTNMAKVLFNRFFAPSMGATPNEDSIAEGLKYLNQFLPVIENQLSNTDMLVSDELTIADIGMIAAMDPFEMIKYDLTPFARVNEWRNKIKEQEFYQNVHAHYAADLGPRE